MLINLIQSSFIKWRDFKSRTSRIEFFTGLVTSGLFFFFNIILSLNLASYFRVNTWFHIINLYIIIAILFAFIQIHSLVARRLNDIKVNPFFAFLPFLLGSLYITLKMFINTEVYGKFIFLIILMVIVISITLLLSDPD
jgi:uncharacterized membrane protein YhaH (DUF805 family)